MISANPIPLRLAVVFALLFQPLAAFAQPNTTSLQLIYEVEWGKVDVVTITADWTFSEDAFELMATSRTIGLTDAFRKYRGEAELSGIIEDGRYMPHRLAISGMSKRRSREAFTTWAPGSGSIATQRQPELDLDKVFPLRDRQIDGALDPFSAMLNILDKVAHTGSCKGSARTYDGLRASELTFYDFGSELVAKDRAFAYEGKALVCGLVGKPTGGHQRKSRWRKKQSKPEDIKIFVAEVRQGLFLPVRMQAKSFLGTVTARLVMPSLIYKKL
ncbi:MAG TPA: hypothetical protein DD668_04830 [Alphaproteobacteria bacterium]|nr:hypothetical protein [Alphaproteobacteria bacterium]